MRKLFYFVSLTITFFLFACEPEQKVVEKPRIFPEYDIALDELLKTPNGVIRGIMLNTKADSIKKIETAEALEADSASLYYEYKIDSMMDYSITYNLVNDSLEEIDVQINCKDLDQSSKIFTDLKTYYEKKLPNPTEDKGYVVYNCFEGQRKPFVVSLTDNSSPTQGIINLVIYKDK